LWLDVHQLLKIYIEIYIGTFLKLEWFKKDYYYITTLLGIYPKN